MTVLSRGAGELASSSGSSSSSFLSTDEAQTSSSSNSAMDQAVATFPLSFLMPNCSALQGLDQQVIPIVISFLCLAARGAIPPPPPPCQTLPVPTPSSSPPGLSYVNLLPVLLHLYGACLPALHLRHQHACCDASACCNASAQLEYMPHVQQ